MTDLRELTTQIVCAHLRTHYVPAEDVPELIRQTHASILNQPITIMVEKVESTDTPPVESPEPERAAGFADAIAKARAHLSSS